MSISVANRTVSPVTGIDISVEWARNAAAYSPPGTIGLSIYNISDGSLLGTYSIPKTGETDQGAIRRFREPIPGSVLPAGDVMLIATDPASSAESRVAIHILAPGELYPVYRSRQVTEGLLYPVAAGLIIVLIAI